MDRENPSHKNRTSLLETLQYFAFVGHRGQISLKFNDAVGIGGLIRHHEVWIVVPVIATLPNRARIRPELPVDEFLAEQKPVVVSRLVLHDVNELAKLFAKLHIAGYAS